MELIQKHMLSTYSHLRLGVAILGIILPLLLWFGGLQHGLPLQDSMSAYYHAADGLMRDYFVGILFSVGIILFLYKGYSRLENLALNIAGWSAVGVALFPMNWNCGDQCQAIPIHAICALLFFSCIAYVCMWRASDTLHEMDDAKREKRYKRLYKIFGIAMLADVVIVTVLILLSNVVGPAVFFLEAIGVWTFSAYWLVKSREISITNSK